MGQIIIEIPQNEVHIYRIQGTERVNQLLAALAAIEKIEREEEEDDILGLWSIPEPIKRAAKQQ